MSETLNISKTLTLDRTVLPRTHWLLRSVFGEHMVDVEQTDGSVHRLEAAVLGFEYLRLLMAGAKLPVLTLLGDLPLQRFFFAWLGQVLAKDRFSGQQYTPVDVCYLDASKLDTWRNTAGNRALMVLVGEVTPEAVTMIDVLNNAVEVCLGDHNDPKHKHLTIRANYAIGTDQAYPPVVHSSLHWMRQLTTTTEPTAAWADELLEEYPALLLIMRGQPLFTHASSPHWFAKEWLWTPEPVKNEA